MTVLKLKIYFKSKTAEFWYARTYTSLRKSLNKKKAPWKIRNLCL